MRTTRWTVWVALALAAVALAGCGGSDDDSSSTTGPPIPANQARAAQAKPITFDQALEFAGLKITIATPVRETPDAKHYMAATWKFHVRIDNVSKNELSRPGFVVRCDSTPERGVEWKGESVDNDVIPKGSFIEGDQVVSGPIDFTEGKALDCTNPTLFLEYLDPDAPSAAAKLP
jgi:hypothetical protein